MLTAEMLCEVLAARFIEEGAARGWDSGADNLADVLGSKAAADYHQTTAAVAHLAAETGGLPVAAVGYTRGAAEEKVIVYLEQKKAYAALLPDEVGGVPVATQVLGKVTAWSDVHPTGRGNFFEKNGRIACGSSCAPAGETYTGTLGAFMTNESETFALSNNHVFAACNHTPVGMPILAPAAGDARPSRPSPSEVCVLRDVVELQSGTPSLVAPMEVDAAFGEVRDPGTVSSWQGDDATGYDTPSTISEPSVDLKVKKVGRTTGLTHGVVEAFVPHLMVVGYAASEFKGSVWFRRIWLVKSTNKLPFAEPGDSGSLVVTEDGSTAVGLVFATTGQSTYGIICQLPKILQTFGNMKLLSNHGI